MNDVVVTPAAPVAQAAAPAAAPALDPNAPQFQSQPGVTAVPPAPVAPAAPAAPAAPTVPPVQQQAEQPSAPAQQAPTEQQALTLNEPTLYKHEPTGNAAYDMAMTAFAAKGFNPDHPAFIPASKGDFTLLEAFAKEKGVDPQYVALARQAYDQISAHHEATHGATIKQALELAGGQERWGKVQAWVQQVADPQEITHWKEQLEKGGVATLSAVKYLSDLYAQHGENQPGTAPATPFNANSSPNTATNGAPLSPQEFRAELGKLIEKVGYSGLESSADYKALQQRRLAWRG